MKVPPLPHITPRWFYATDIPITKPFKYNPTARATKFIPFTTGDSDRIENAYHNSKPVNVNEDGLFTVDLHKKIMSPVYWTGPGYEVRRGIWFNDNNPVPDLIGEQIEDAFKKYRPDLHDKVPSIRLKSEKQLFQEKYGNWPYSQFDDLSDLDKILHFQSKDEGVLLNEGGVPKIVIDNLPGSKSVFGYVVKRGYIDEEEDEKDEKKQTKKKVKKENEKKESASKKVGDPIDETEGSSETGDSTNVLDSIKNAKLVHFDYTTLLNETNKMFQSIMENDFANNSLDYNNDYDREIDHLVLCVHGIGQALSSKYASINFAHDCNQFRQLIKKEFILNNPDKDDKENNDNNNSKVQVLPIIWRHDIKFDRILPDSKLPKLASLSVDADSPIRKVTADVLLDILLYYEPKYHEQMLQCVANYANEIYKKFLSNNPNFKGKVSLVGHSLGSAIVLDILHRQSNKKVLDFEVNNFFSLGSPNGIFKLIRGEQILPSMKTENYKNKNAVTPAINSIYNIFYSTDPVGYRIEPLIHNDWSDVKPAEGEPTTGKVPPEIKDPIALKRVQMLNPTGRVDWVLKTGSLDMFGVASHIQYLSDPKVARILLKELNRQ
ncbi:putative carboxylic ester hydrolase [Pichia kluyveri]|uniref:Carboxylic ester hydrolase n=1 Tax=Pichia kluyveri TaxID=36015 RepID=A0AAV5QYM3_PICKL|nr:putative carboxylic ester hydrolase [Pichia kluyveri]